MKEGEIAFPVSLVSNSVDEFTTMYSSEFRIQCYCDAFVCNNPMRKNYLTCPFIYFENKTILVNEIDFFFEVEEKFISIFPKKKQFFPGSYKITVLQSKGV